VADERADQTILVVDDQAALRETLTDFLSLEGYRVVEAASVAEARLRFAEQRPDLILLDLNMPGGDGLSYAAEVRAASATPIIILSGKGALVDRVVGLEVGADDYLAKPFELRELLARIRAVMRRAGPSGVSVSSPSISGGSAPERLARFGSGLAFNPGRRQFLSASGVVIDLTGAEYKLLASLVERPNRVMTRDAISDLIQGRELSVFDRSIDTLVSRLRRKLEPYVDASQLIRTLRGEGYVLATDVEWSGGSDKARG
jgi:two-component system OmpR family response regulator